MNSNSRFSVATQILVVLATDPKRPAKSAFLAASVNTNPVVIRRILGQLSQAGLVKSTSGPNGGTQLLVRAEELTMDRVYRAVDDGPLSHPHYRAPNANCPIGANIRQTLEPLLEDATDAFLGQLAHFNLGDLTRQIAATSGIVQMLEQGVTVAELQTNYCYEKGSFKKNTTKGEL